MGSEQGSGHTIPCWSLALPRSGGQKGLRQWGGSGWQPDVAWRGDSSPRAAPCPAGTLVSGRRTRGTSWVKLLWAKMRETSIHQVTARQATCHQAGGKDERLVLSLESEQETASRYCKPSPGHWQRNVWLCTGSLASSICHPAGMRDWDSPAQSDYSICAEDEEEVIAMGNRCPPGQTEENAALGEKFPAGGMKAASCQLCLCLELGTDPVQAPSVAQWDALTEQPGPGGAKKSCSNIRAPSEGRSPDPQPEQAAQQALTPHQSLPLSLVSPCPPQCCPEGTFPLSPLSKARPTAWQGVRPGRSTAAVGREQKTLSWEQTGGLNPCQMPTRAVHHPPQRSVLPLAFRTRRGSRDSKGQRRAGSSGSSRLECRGWSRGTNIHPDVELLERRRHDGMEEGEVRGRREQRGRELWGSGEQEVGAKGPPWGRVLLPRAAHISSQALGCGSSLPARSHLSHASIPLPGH